MSRAGRFTIETKKKEYFSDFLTNLDINPVTGYLAKAVDRQAIEISMRNLLLTNRGEWPFESSLGSNIRATMFELADDRLVTNLQNYITETLTLFEPRVETHEVSVTQPNADPNSLYISIVYSILNIPDEVFQFDVTVNRVR